MQHYTRPTYLSDEVELTTLWLKVHYSTN